VWALAAASLFALAACAPDELASPRTRPAATPAVVAPSPAGDVAGALTTTSTPRLAYAYSTQWEWWPSSWTASPAYSYSSSGGAITFTRLSPGSYRVDFEGLSRPNISPSNPLGDGSETVVATAYSQDQPGVVCNALSWFSWGSVSRLTARVDCVDTGTNQFVDSRFNILVVGNGSLPAPSAFLLADKPTATQYLADPKWSYRSGTGLLGVSHAAAVGSWDLRMGNGNPAGTTFLVNAHANPSAPTRELCKVGEFKSLGPNVRCFDADGQPRDVQYQALQVGRGRAGKRFGFAFADQPSRTTPYAAHAAWSYNSSGGDIQVTRGALGVYAVRFRGLQGTWYGPGAHVQVTPYGPAFASCNVHSWYDETPPSTSTPGLLVWVRCANQHGQPVDSRFSAMVIE
jgi:hypothetical protein